MSLVVGRSSDVLGNPTGLTVVSGIASTQTSGSQLNVTVSPTAFLNWNTFNIQAGETTSFLQPSVNSVVINEIGDVNPSQIFGSLKANGTVILANANGFYFGPNSMVKVGGSFIATTAPLTPDFGAGSAWQFTGMPPLASIVNYGQVQVGQGNSLYLIAEQIANHGTLDAPGGTIGLYAGQEVLLNDRADGRGFGVTVQLPAGSVDNEGNLTADAGTIALQAKVVNQDGLIQANSVQNNNGVVELVASDVLTVGTKSDIEANGDASPANTSASPGGFVVLQSGGTYTDSASSVINVAGEQGGQDGIVEIFGSGTVKSSIGQSFATLINPFDITLSANPTSFSKGINLNEADLSADSQIDIHAADNIDIQLGGAIWNLPDSGSTASLNLTAGNNITLDSTGTTAAIVAGQNWNVNLTAGAGFVPTPARPLPAAGTDEIYLNGNSGIQTQNGDINIVAGQDVILGKGYINTFNGGNISVAARYGNINAGTSSAGAANGNSDSSSPLTVDANHYDYLGGIATVGGGNVTLDAGNNVISTLGLHPNLSYEIPAASGAYNGGNVTVIAGNQINGSFLVSDGTGILEAGVTVDSANHVTVNNPTSDIGTSTTAATLSLISGNWQAYAGRNIYLSEVNNPNGTFNRTSITVPVGLYPGNIDSGGNITAPNSAYGYLYNYAPDAGTYLWAGNAITLGYHPPQIPGEPTTIVYPPNLSLVAGVGGITLDQSIILYPSSQGSLNINDAGNLTGTVVNTASSGIVMSDSGLPGYSTFAGGHAVTPLHLNDPHPVVVEVGGTIANFNLTVPTFADITIDGGHSFTTTSGQVYAGTYNFNFVGQNLSPSEKTYIDVLGNISFQGLVTSVSLSSQNATPLPVQWFDLSLSSSPDITQYLAYDSSTGLLSFRGTMTQDDLSFLQNETFVVNGATESLTTAQKAVLQTLYTDSQGVYENGGGIRFNGPGSLNISANNMDLGTSAGIRVNQTYLPELWAGSIDGATLNVTLQGNLGMTTSVIENAGWLGGININAGGTLDVGQQDLFGESSSAPRGIVTTSDGGISVSAGGNINVDGSRIATYDGGDISLVSQSGDVSAGAGGAGYITLDQELQLNAQGQVTSLVYGEEVTGSGIMALSDPASTIGVGNITVKALQGSIFADLGGIEQLAFNRLVGPNNFIELDAGKDISAGDSGVIGSDIRVKAGGNITGLFVGSGTVDINAGQNFSGTVIGSTTVSLSAGGSVSGSILGGESVAVSGEQITASLISGSVTATGDTSGASMGIPQSNVTQQNAQVADNASSLKAKTDDSELDDLKKKREIKLAQKVGRVTVLLPTKD